MYVTVGFLFGLTIYSFCDKCVFVGNSLPTLICVPDFTCPRMRLLCTHWPTQKAMSNWKDGLQPMFKTKPNIQHKRTKILKMYAEREATTNENDVSLYIRNEYFFVVTPSTSSTVYSPYGNGKPLTHPTHTHTY